MLDIKIKYKGESFSNIESAVNKAAEDKLLEYVNNKLEPLKNEISEAGGKVTIHLNPDFTGVKVEVNNIPEELKGRILQVFR